MASTHADMRALEAFIAENDELLALEDRIARFNVFDALDIARREIQHSNFLAWLIRPEESHGQDALFLRGLLMDLLRKARDQNKPQPVGVIDMEDANLHDVEVHREWARRSSDRIDLLIECKQPRIIVVIENKVDSAEHSSQLDRYESLVRSSFPEYKPLLVYLTPDGEDASNESWVAYSYADIHRVFARVARQSGAFLGPDVAVFLDHYLKLLERRFMQDKEIDELCQKIYRNHKQAIDLLFERIDVGGSGVASIAARWLRDRPQRWHLVYDQARYVKFYPMPWLNALCNDEGLPKPNGVDLFFELQVGRSALHLRCVIGKADDPERRKRIIRRLIQDPREFGFRMQRKEPTDRWTRISAERILEVNEDEPPADDAVAAAMEAKLGPFEKSLEQIAAAVLSTK